MRLAWMRGVPFPSEALRFGELVWGHQARNPVATLDGAFSILTGTS